MTDSFAHEPPSLLDATEGEWPARADREAIDYDPDSDTYRATVDGDDESVAMAVVYTVAVVSETVPTDLPPLYYACDPAAIEAVTEPAVRGPTNGKTVSFTFAGYDVTVHGYGFVDVRPPEASESE